MGIITVIQSVFDVTREWQLLDSAGQDDRTVVCIYRHLRKSNQSITGKQVEQNERSIVSVCSFSGKKFKVFLTDSMFNPLMLIVPPEIVVRICETFGSNLRIENDGAKYLK